MKIRAGRFKIYEIDRPVDNAIKRKRNHNYSNQILIRKR